MKPRKIAVRQGALFEDDFLIRTLGSIGSNPEIALTELVANARDAGASRVNVVIPSEKESMMTIEDDGVGMTARQFQSRWMTLGYDRQKHQGAWVEYPDERKAKKRRAFGRHGVGRHGLLCFADSYVVESTRDGNTSTFQITTTSGRNPFEIASAGTSKHDGHGTRLKTVVTRNLPKESRIRQVLGSRFLQDPEFEVWVNGRGVPLTKLTGFIAEDSLTVANTKARVFIFDTKSSSRISAYQGVAFWVAGKLVGTPSWIVGDRAVLDGRTRAGRRFNIVIQCADDFADVVDSDWAGFKKLPLRDELFRVVGDFVTEKTNELMRDKASETSIDALRKARNEIRDLPRSAAREVIAFATAVTRAEPGIATESLNAAVSALINLEKTRSGAALLEKLARLPEQDVEALDQLLNDWSARDALAVLDEIDGRLKLVTAIERFGEDEAADELRTLHPLVAQARWIFGPEFDSPEFASNQSLRNAVEKVFNKRIPADAFDNPRRRPDLLSLSDATLSATATETIDGSSGLAKFSTVLLIELKKGRASIGRSEMNQADGYAQDLLQSGHLDGPPFINAFVVGHSIAERTETVKTVGEIPKARVTATTYAQLTRTAGRRLFRLRSRLSDRYERMSSDQLLDDLLGTTEQLDLEINGLKE
jgi:hypothetical protein